MTCGLRIEQSSKKAKHCYCSSENDNTVHRKITDDAQYNLTKPPLKTL